MDAVGTQYAVGVSAKESLYPHAVDAVDAVGVGAKGQLTVYSANKDGGGVTFSAKRSLYPHAVDAVDAVRSRC